MTWQQCVIAFGIIFSLFTTTYRATRSALTPTETTVAIMLAIAWQVTVILVLSSGGFW